MATPDAPAVSLHAVAALGRRRSRALGLALVAILATVSVAPATVSAATAPTIEVTLTDPVLRGSGTPNALIHLELRDADGRLRRERSVSIGKRGRYGANLFGVYPQPTDIVTAESNGVRRTLTVPDIRPLVDREDDVVSGEAPPGSTVAITVYLGVLCCGPSVRARRTVTAGPGGRYRADFSDEIDIVGPNEVGVVVPVGRHQVSARGVAPWMNIRHGSNLFIGLATPGTSFPIELRDDQGERRFRMRMTVDPTQGFYGARWQEPDGDPIYVQPGDRIVRPGIPDIVIPTFRFRADAATGRITGRCIPNASVMVWIGGQDPIVDTDAQGRYTIDLSATGGFGAHAEWTVFCYWAERDRYIAVGQL